MAPCLICGALLPLFSALFVDFYDLQHVKLAIQSSLTREYKYLSSKKLKYLTILRHVMGARMSFKM